MKILKRLEVPTGHILVGQGEHGPLEFLSLGDYGKAYNIKADFLGHSVEINGVQHRPLMSLTNKWVITISTQYGCSMKCNYCDANKVGPGRNATIDDLRNQVIAAMDIHPKIRRSNRLNLHFARMGEPTFNPNILMVTPMLADELEPADWHLHPVVSTMMPKDNSNLEGFIQAWIDQKRRLDGNAGLQISVNTTEEEAREEQFGGSAMALEDAARLLEKHVNVRRGRKVALNFALCDRYKIDAAKLKKLFNPRYFMCKITPIHETKACKDNNISTKDGYSSYAPYREVENNLKASGFDVLVFIPSKEEDESRITCGNVILSDKEQS